MPTYTITDPQSQRTLRLTGDRPPTETEIEQAFAASTRPATNAADKPAPMINAQSAGLPPYDPSSMGMGGFTAPPTPADMAAAKTGLANTLRAAPMAAAALFPPAGALAYLGMGTAGALTELGARGIEGQEVANRDAMGAAARAAIMFGAPIARPFTAPLFSGRGMLNSVVGGLQMGGATLGGNFIDRAISKDSPVTLDDLKAAGKSAIWPAVLGAAIQMGSGKLLSNAEDLSIANANRDTLKEIGITNPTLGMVLPEYAPLEQQVAGANPVIQNKIATAMMPATKKFNELVGRAESNQDVASQLAPLIPQADAAEAAYKQAQAMQQKAQQAADAAMAKTDMPIQQRSALLEKTTNDELNAVAEMARRSEEQQRLVDSIGGQTGKAEAITSVIRAGFSARQRAAQNMMAATGINPTAPLVDKGTLLAAAREAMGSRASSEAGKKILAVIDAAKEAPQAAMPMGGATLGVEQSRALAAMLSAKGANKDIGKAASAGLAAVTPKEPVMLSLQEFQDLRNRISDAFVGTAENTMSSAEQLASTAYAKMGEATMPAVAATYGQSGAMNYRDFLSFWKRTSQLRDTKFGGSFLRGQVTDEAIGEMAKKLMAGKSDELTNYKRFIDVLGEQDKAAAAHAQTTMVGAVRNAFLQDAMTAGVVDYRKLARSLNQAAQPSGAPFDIGAFGFGNRGQIANWNKVVNEFKPTDVTPEALASVMQSPDVQKALNVGGESLAPRLRTILAEKAFNKRVLDAAATAERGMVAPARQAYAEAATFAKQAGIDAKQAEIRARAAMDDPVLGAFKGKGDYKLTMEAGRMGGDGTVSDLIRNMKWEEARGLLRGLDEIRPNTAKMVRSRILAGEFEKLGVPEVGLPGETQRLDVNRVRAYFEPSSVAEPNSNITWLSKVMPEEAVKFKSFARALADLDDVRRSALVSGKIPHDAVEAASFARMIGTGSAMRGSIVRASANRMLEFFRQRRYNLLSAMITDEGFKNAFYKANGDLGEAIGSLPTQKAALLLMDARIKDELADRKKAASRPPPPAPAMPPPQANVAPSQFREGQIYRDPQTGARKRYVNGQWADAA